MPVSKLSQGLGHKHLKQMLSVCVVFTPGRQGMSSQLMGHVLENIQLHCYCGN